MKHMLLTALSSDLSADDDDSSRSGTDRQETQKCVGHAALVRPACVSAASSCMLLPAQYEGPRSMSQQPLSTAHQLSAPGQPQDRSGTWSSAGHPWWRPAGTCQWRTLGGCRQAEAGTAARGKSTAQVSKAACCLQGPQIAPWCLRGDGLTDAMRRLNRLPGLGQQVGTAGPDRAAAR